MIGGIPGFCAEAISNDAGFMHTELSNPCGQAKAKPITYGVSGPFLNFHFSMAKAVWPFPPGGWKEHEATEKRA
jgi:hypothetical protein